MPAPNNQMTVLDNMQLPARLRATAVAVAEANNDLFSGAGMAFPVLSYKGKVWHIVEGDERTLIAHPETGDPIPAIEIVLLKANPAKSKVYYATGFVEGTAEKPDCFSNDGITPDAQAKTPQSPTCEACPNNVWGSRISDNGSKTKACADSKRSAVAPAGEIDNPMLLRTPPASLANLQAYGVQLSKRGIPYNEVVTRVGFDHTVAHPQLEFKFVRFLTDDEAAQAAEVVKSDKVGYITGMMAMPARDPAPQPAAAPAPQPVVQPVVAPAPAPQPVAAAPAPAPVAQPVAAAPAAAPKPRSRKGNGFGGAATVAPAAAPVVAPAAPVAVAPAPVAAAFAPTAVAQPAVAMAPAPVPPSTAALASRLDTLLGELDD